MFVNYRILDWRIWNCHNLNLTGQEHDKWIEAALKIDKKILHFVKLFLLKFIFYNVTILFMFFKPNIIVSVRYIHFIMFQFESIGSNQILVLTAPPNQKHTLLSIRDILKRKYQTTATQFISHVKSTFIHHPWHYPQLTSNSAKWQCPTRRQIFRNISITFYLLFGIGEEWTFKINSESIWFSWLIWEIWWQHTENKLKIVSNMHRIMY